MPYKESSTDIGCGNDSVPSTSGPLLGFLLLPKPMGHCMKPKGHKRSLRGRDQQAENTFSMNNPVERERLIDALAMHLCPSHEWRAYEKKNQSLVWQSRHQKTAHRAKIYAFPVWRKYRHQAEKIVNLHQVVPMLRHLPLPVSTFLGEVFF